MKRRAAPWRASLCRASPEAVASLPMYDFPELREAHDALWRAVTVRLQDEGLVRAPAELVRDEAGETAWGNPDLLMSQTCGYPLALGLRGRLQVVATPGYRARGCQGPFHRSVVLVRLRDKAMNLSELKGRRLALNAPDSNTGMNLLRAEIAPLASGRSFFRDVVVTGAHVRSIAAVAEGVADTAAVDCVTWALLERVAPSLCGQLRVLAWSIASLGLPWVTGASTSTDELRLLQRTLEAVAADPTLRDVRRTLLLDAWHPTSNLDYRSLIRLENIAAGQGYPELT